MVLNRSGLVWIGRRRDAPGEPEGPGAWWQMPQGGIDDDEDPAKAALRELEEETGIRSVASLAESPRWYTYDLPGPAAQGLGRTLSRAEAEVVRGALHRRRRRDRYRAPPGTRTSSTPGAGPSIGELLGLIVPFKRDVYEQVAARIRDAGRPGLKAERRLSACASSHRARRVAADWRDKSRKYTEQSTR